MNKLSKFTSISNFILFGAGDARKPVESFLKSIGKVVIGYSDNNINYSGTLINNLPFIPPHQIKNYLNNNTGIIISSSYQSQIANQLLNELDISNDIVFPYFTEMFFPQFGEREYEKNVSKLDELAKHLGDNESYDYIKRLIDYRRYADSRYLIGNPKLVGFYDYLSKELFYEDNQNAIDCGAYIGDTAEYMLSKANFNKIFAFEGLNKNFEQLKNWIKQNKYDDKVIPYKYFLSDKIGSTEIKSNIESSDPRAGLNNFFESDLVEKVNVTTIDEIIEGIKIDLIKIDVEGADLNVLMGAKELIKSQKPKLMVASYHKSSHLYEIPFYIKDINPEYKIFAGHHNKCLYEIEYYMQ